LDELDTSHTVVVMTTNRYDLLDEAVIDRLLPYEFPLPSTDALLEIARDKARAQGLGEKDLAPILARIAEGEPLRSIREVERLVTRVYVDKVLR
jgi:AAA+ superfamily predicted ATPase